MMKAIVIIVNILGALLLGFLIPSRIQILASISFALFAGILIALLFSKNHNSGSKKLAGILAVAILLMGLFFSITFYKELLHDSSYGETHFFVLSSTVLMLASGISTLIYVSKK